MLFPPRVVGCVLQYSRLHPFQCKRANPLVSPVARSPAAACVHDMGTGAQGRLFYTMKPVQGVTLGEVLFKPRTKDAAMIARCPLNQLPTIFQKVCDAVAFAHSRSFIPAPLRQMGRVGASPTACC